MPKPRKPAGSRGAPPGGTSRRRGAERPPTALADDRRRRWTKLDPEYTATPHFVRFDGHWLHFVDEGKPNNPVVFLIHGNPTWSFYWRKLIDHLRHEYRVVAIDLLGFGFSEKPADYAYRLENHVRSVEFLIEELALSDVTLGMHDWGGPIGMGYARRHPQNVARLFAMNTAAFHLPGLPASLRLARTPLLGPLLVEHLDLFVRGATGISTPARGRLPRLVRRGYRIPFAGPTERRSIRAFVKDIPTGPRHRSWEELQATECHLGGFADRPGCLLWGMRDPIFDARFLERWIEHWPEARVRRFPEAGHWLMEERPEEVCAEVATFLADNPLAERPQPRAGAPS